MPDIDSSEYEKVYEAFKRTHTYRTKQTKAGRKAKRLANASPKLTPKPKKFKRDKKRNGPVRDVFDKEAWVKTQREYLRWRKTPEFQVWRRKQFLRQGGTCYYCDDPIFGGVRENVEHVIPKIRRGDNRPSNLVLACAKCNKDKNTTMLSYRKRQELKVKNRAKRGTYSKTRELYPTEADVIEHIRNIAL